MPLPQGPDNEVVLDEEGHLTRLVNHRPTLNEGTVPP